MAADLVPDTAVLRDVVAPSAVAIGPAGVFVVLMKEDGGGADLRAHVHTVRAVLDGAGLRAMPVEGVLSRPGFDDLDLIGTWMAADTRFGPGTIRRAVAALTPERATPPWVATVAGGERLEDQFEPALKGVGDARAQR